MIKLSSDPGFLFESGHLLSRQALQLGKLDGDSTLKDFIERQKHLSEPTNGMTSLQTIA
jgi:hypothetical protein